MSLTGEMMLIYSISYQWGLWVWWRLWHALPHRLIGLQLCFWGPPSSEWCLYHPVVQRVICQPLREMNHPFWSWFSRFSWGGQDLLRLRYLDHLSFYISGCCVNRSLACLTSVPFLHMGHKFRSSDLSAPGPVLMSDMGGSTSKTLSDNSQFI